MKRNSRLFMALHILGHLAACSEKARTSADIADHVGTNPVVVRRVLGPLRKAGILSSEKGHAGGWRLRREPKDITLADVYLALGERLIAEDTAPEMDDCSVEKTLRKEVTSVLADVEHSLVARLKATSINDICGE